MLSGIKSIISGVVGWGGSTAAATTEHDETGTGDSNEGVEKTEPSKHPDATRPIEKRDYTSEELREFDGSVPDVAILVAIRGTIFDVTSRADIYGMYHMICPLKQPVWCTFHRLAILGFEPEIEVHNEGLTHFAP